MPARGRLGRQANRPRVSAISLMLNRETADGTDASGEPCSDRRRSGTMHARALLATFVFPVTLAAQGTKPAAVDPRAAAALDTARRVVISIAERRLWVVEGDTDTLLAAPVAVGSGKTLSTATRSWTFRTPRGVRTVMSKEIDPVWVRPDWAYVEVARKHNLRLAYLDPAKPVVLSDGSVLVVRDRTVGVLAANEFAALPLDDEIVFDNVLYVPPTETLNRHVRGQLGRYRLNLGDGIGVHGTPEVESIGRAVTHGCLRLGDGDLEWMYLNIGIGTRVYIF